MSQTPAAPSGLTVAHAAGETEAVVTWQQPAGSIAPSDTRVRWARFNPDPLSGSGSWLGTAVTRASSHRISGLVRGMTYVIEVAALSRDDNDRQSVSPPASTIVAMLPPNEKQEQFFSVLVPYKTGPAYFRLGPADQSGAEHALLDLAHHSELDLAIVPAAADLGPEATTDVVIASSRNIGVLTGGDIRMRSLGDVVTEGASVATVSSHHREVVHERNEQGDRDPSGRIIKYTRSHRSSGTWWTTCYDRSMTLGFSTSASGGYRLSADYQINVGHAAQQSHGSTFTARTGVATTDVSLSLLEVVAGVGELRTKLLGYQYELLNGSFLAASTIRLELSDPAWLSLSTALKAIAGALASLSAVVALFQTAVTIARFVYVDTTRGKDTVALDQFITDTSIPFYISNQSATALLHLAAAALGAAQLTANTVRLAKQKRIPDLGSTATRMGLEHNRRPGTFVEMANSPSPFIRLNNGESTAFVLAHGFGQLVANTIELRVQGSRAPNFLEAELGQTGQVDFANVLSIDSKSAYLQDGVKRTLLGISMGDIKIQSPSLVDISSDNDVVLGVGGTTSIKLTKTGIEINGTGLDVSALLTQFGKG